jgi:hypothetical protein
VVDWSLAPLPALQLQPHCLMTQLTQLQCSLDTDTPDRRAAQLHAVCGLTALHSLALEPSALSTFGNITPLS